MFDRLGLVVRASKQHASVAVANALNGGRSANYMIGLATGRTHQSSTKAGRNDFLIDHQFNDGVDPLPYRKVVAVEGFGLGEVPREPVQNVAVARIFFFEALTNPVQNVFVGREVPTSNGLFDLEAKLRVPGDMIANDIAGRNMRDPVSLREQAALGSLTRTGRAEENDTHYFMKPS